MAAFKQYEENSSVLNNYAKAIRQRYLQNFEIAEQRLGALNEIKELFPALKAESSFSKAACYAYSRVGN